MEMDPDVRKLLILLMFQLSLFTTLEYISIDQERVFLWHMQQIGVLTLALHAFKLRRGRHPRRLWAHDQGCLGRDFLTKICWARSMRGSSKGVCVWMYLLLSTCVVLLLLTCRD